MLAANNSGFLQNGPNGADNLVLFEFVPVPPDPPENIPPLEFTVLGNLSLGIDMDGDGLDDNIGTFSGLEWTSGNPSSGTLIGCVLNEGNGSGEFYQIDPATVQTTLIGSGGSGMVESLDPNSLIGGTGYGNTAGSPTLGGSGIGLTVNLTTVAGAVTNVQVVSPGSGYQAGDIITLVGGSNNASIRVESTQQSEFSDLAYNVADGRMYGLMNNIIDDGEGDVEYGPNTLWFDSNGDLIPDTSLGSNIRTAGFCLGTLQTLASGLAFDSRGTLYIYDSIEETVLINPSGVDSGNPGVSTCVNPPPPPFEALETGLTSSELRQGNGLGIGNDTLVIGTDAEGRNTFVSYYEIPSTYFPMVPPDPIPEVFTAGFFPREFFQTTFFASVAIGDLVGATPDLTDLPTFFPDNVIVNRGLPAKDAVLEALVLSDDIRYCVFPVPPAQPGQQPVEIDFVFTLPDPASLSVLGLEIEGQVNTPGLLQFIRVLNVNTGNYDFIGTEVLPIGNDGTLNIDLSLSLENFVDPQNGTLVLRIATVQSGLVTSYPWQIKYDAVLVVAD